MGIELLTGISSLMQKIKSVSIFRVTWSSGPLHPENVCLSPSLIRMLAFCWEMDP